MSWLLLLLQGFDGSLMFLLVDVMCLYAVVFGAITEMPDTITVMCQALSL